MRVRILTPSGRLGLALGALALAGLAAMPLWASSGTIRMLVELACYIAIAQMWNLLAGYGGLVSVGQQAFLGAGAYALFVLAMNFGVNPFLAVPLAALVPLVLAVPSYALLHRLEGAYFSIGTWVLAEVFRLTTTTLPLVNGGAGMSLRVMTGYDQAVREAALSAMAAALLAVTVGGSYLLLRSRYGLALTAMRDNPVAAASQGVDVRRLRFWVYVAAAAGTGLAGAVYFMMQLRITPGAAYDPKWAMVGIFITMIGGLGSLEGVLLGALVYYFANRWFGQYGAVYLVVLGLLTLVMALVARRGLWGLLAERRDWPLFPTRRVLLRAPPQDR